MYYLAAYVKRSTFSEGRLLDYDQSGRIVLRYRDSADGKLRSEALDPFELIRHWLLDPFAPAESGLRPALRAVCLARLPAAWLDEASETAPLLPQHGCLPPQKAKRRPRQREIVGIAKETVNGLSRSVEARFKQVESPFHRETSRRSGPDP